MGRSKKKRAEHPPHYGPFYMPCAQRRPPSILWMLWRRSIQQYGSSGPRGGWTRVIGDVLSYPLFHHWHEPDRRCANGFLVLVIQWQLQYIKPRKFPFPPGVLICLFYMEHAKLALSQHPHGYPESEKYIKKPFGACPIVSPTPHR